jgi:hypothetical protein
MARHPNWPKSKLALALAMACACRAVTVPAGTELELRLKSKVSSKGSKPKDAVEAILAVPVVVGGQFVLPAGIPVRGIVQEAHPAPGAGERALLNLSFYELELGGKKIKLNGVVTDVDNARESVATKTGQILGIIPSETISGRIESGIGRVGQKYGGLAELLAAAKGTVLKSVEADIDYGPGVEMTMRLAAPLEIASLPADAAPKLAPIGDEAALEALVAKQPFQTTAQSPPKPSDMTNLMFVGSEETLRKGFEAAGWSAAAALSGESKLETFRAIAELRGYKEAPVSILLLEGQPPDLVFQKQNNTFAMRHHLRIWRRPGTFAGKPVWVCAATHDTGIDFSEENHTFIHKIDPQIDRERAKVVNDLLLTGMVDSLAVVDRPKVPTKSQNATGDELITDGRQAVVILK